jgi:hypothetical protein
LKADLIVLSEVPTVLKQKYGSSVEYRQLYDATINTRIPAERIKGRWYVNPDNLPTIAKTFGIAA